MAFKMKPRGGKRSNPYSGLMKKGLISSSPLYQATEPVKTQAEIDAEADAQANKNAQDNLASSTPEISETYFDSGQLKSRTTTTKSTGTGKSTAFSTDPDELAAQKLWIKNNPELYKKLLAEKKGTAETSKTEYFEETIPEKKKVESEPTSRNVATELTGTKTLVGYDMYGKPVYEYVQGREHMAHKTGDSTEGLDDVLQGENITTSPIEQKVKYDDEGFAINSNDVAVDESQKGVEVRYFKSKEDAGWKDKTAEKKGTTPHVRVSKEK